jgi:hypothetical protein
MKTANLLLFFIKVSGQQLSAAVLEGRIGVSISQRIRGLNHKLEERQQSVKDKNEEIQELMHHHEALEKVVLTQ